MLLVDLLAHILDNALDAALQYLRTGFGLTVVVHHIPAELAARQIRCGLGSVNNIGGQDCVNLSKPGKLFWGPKSAGSCQQNAGRKKHIALKAGVEGI
jgi:hypothetical protein